MKTVVMLVHEAGLNPGETAGFEDAMAEKLVARGKARWPNAKPVVPEEKLENEPKRGRK